MRLFRFWQISREKSTFFADETSDLEWKLDADADEHDHCRRRPWPKRRGRFGDSCPCSCDSPYLYWPWSRGGCETKTHTKGWSEYFLVQLLRVRYVYVKYCTYVQQNNTQAFFFCERREREALLAFFWKTAIVPVRCLYYLGT